MTTSDETLKTTDITSRFKLTERAEALLDLIESDFGQSSRSVRIEAIVCELQNARSMMLWEAVARAAKEMCLETPNAHLERRADYEAKES